MIKGGQQIQALVLTDDIFYSCAPNILKKGDFSGLWELCGSGGLVPL